MYWPALPASFAIVIATPLSPYNSFLSLFHFHSNTEPLATHVMKSGCKWGGVVCVRECERGRRKWDKKNICLPRSHYTFFVETTGATTIYRKRST
jgi:hypothetical protein